MKAGEKIRLDGKRLVEGRERLLESSQRHEHAAALANGLDIAGRDGERLVVCDERLVMTVESVEHGAEIAQGVDRMRVHLERGVDQSRGLGTLALLLPQDPEQVQRVEMIGPHVENRGIALFRFGEHSALMQRDGALGGGRQVAVGMRLR